MGTIKVMSEELSNKIAAGEVVERVSSVVKELVENSIDANADNIKIDLLSSGTKSIVVTDNGTGMDEADAILAFTPHATSKIKNESDLYFINTLGFRGEALPSIASVSDITLVTSKGNKGTEVHLKGGKLISSCNVDSIEGTKITVGNLLYNTPARLKFLKSLNTELNYIVGLLEKLSLSHPNISFSLCNDNKEILKTTGNGDLLKTIHEIFGYNTSKNMVYIKGENLDYDINGYVSNINISKSNRNGIITLVNGRVVSNSYLNRIICEAYHTFLAENKFPVVVININTDPTLVDVNIHPTKQDIKFSKMDTLEDLLFSLIRDTLNNTDNTFKAYKEVEVKDYDIIDNNVYDINSNMVSDINLNLKNVEQEKITFEVKEKINDYNETSKVFINPVGLAMGTYLFASDDENVYMIDIHAANERINYEKYLVSLKETKVNTTELLFPINIELTKEEFLVIKDSMQLLNNLGFVIEEFGINTYRILSHPTWLLTGYEEESIKKIFDIIVTAEGDFDRVKFNERLSINLACKMSVKANTNINYEEQETLIRRLFKCEFPYTCPHGRPTIIKYTKYELEKLFKRVN